MLDMTLQNFLSDLPITSDLQTGHFMVFLFLGYYSILSAIIDDNG